MAKAEKDNLRGVTTNVTPAQAAKWLEGKTANRNIRQSKVAEYAADMRAGRWRLTHQGIAFDQDGCLIDGQHRLWAVVESDATIQMMVTRDVPRDYLATIDGGLPRTLADVAQIDDQESHVQTVHVSVARAMMPNSASSSLRRPTRQETVAFLHKHHGAIWFAVDAFGTHKVAGITIAPVYATLARAYYSQDHDRLKRFAEVLRQVPFSQRTKCQD